MSWRTVVDGSQVVGAVLGLIAVIAAFWAILLQREDLMQQREDLALQHEDLLRERKITHELQILRDLVQCVQNPDGYREANVLLALILPKKQKDLDDSPNLRRLKELFAQIGSTGSDPKMREVWTLAGPDILECVRRAADHRIYAEGKRAPQTPRTGLLKALWSRHKQGRRSGAA